MGSWEGIEIYVSLISLGIFIFLIDDLFIDLISLVKKIGPSPISKDILFNKRIPNSEIAIMVANWKEEAVLEEMVRGNMRNLVNKNIHLFLGVYPNDTKTLTIALNMQMIYPNVHAVINSEEGPTYKGQMLNEVVKGIFVKETELNLKFQGFIMHDSEDILDQNIPNLYRLGLTKYDFIQTPVFSLPVKYKELTAGSYMDEFAEVHCKDLLVRKYLGAALPSAGVGTCLSRELIQEFLSRQNGRVFLPDSLTEDYQLGLQSTEWGFKSTFLCHYVEGDHYSKIISTKEFFPNTFGTAVRQKTRWTTGIAFQGNKNLGWFGNFWQRLFLWRDRKGPLNAILISNLIILMTLVFCGHGQLLPESSFIRMIFWFNTVGMLVRLGIRMNAVEQLYGWRQACLVIVRWPVAMAVNMCAGLRSIEQHTYSSITGAKIKWAKTEHRLPEGFGENLAPEPQHLAVVTLTTTLNPTLKPSLTTTITPSLNSDLSITEDLQVSDPILAKVISIAKAQQRMSHE